MRIFLIACAVAVLSFFADTANAACVGTANFYSCNDASGNNYTVNRMGNMTTVQGNNPNTGSQWNQTSTTMGNMTMTNGVTNGRPWNETQTNFGNGFGTVNGTNSEGQPYSYSCAPYTGCR